MNTEGVVVKVVTLVTLFLRFVGGVRVTICFNCNLVSSAGVSFLIAHGVTIIYLMAYMLLSIVVVNAFIQHRITYCTDSVQTNFSS